MIIYSEWSQDGLATTELSLQEMKGAGRGLFIRQIVVQGSISLSLFFFFHFPSEITEIRHIGI